MIGGDLNIMIVVNQCTAHGVEIETEARDMKGLGEVYDRWCPIRVGVWCAVRVGNGKGDRPNADS